MIAALLAATMSAATPTTALLPPPHVRAGERVFPDARPAIWVVNDHDTIIYLFGTFHALDGQSDWFNDEVLTAFEASDELILETLVPKAPQGGQPAARSRGDEAAQQAMRPVAPVGPVAGSASFLSTSKMVISAGRSRGMSTDKGADAVLRQAAEDSGKPVGGLESFEFQMRLFGTMRSTSPTPAGATPAQAANVNAALSAVLSRLQDAWNRGDVESFAPMLDQMRAGSPENYKTLFIDRNTRWASWIARRLQKPGTVFVAVGAGHLAGRDSVQHKLAEAGIRSARIN